MGLEIMSIRANIILAGTAISETEFIDLISNAVVLPREHCEYWSECIEHVELNSLTDKERQRIKRDLLSKCLFAHEDRPLDHLKPIRLTQDVAVCSISLHGSNCDAHYAGGVDFTMQEHGKVAVLDPDGWRREGEVPSGYFRDIANAVFASDGAGSHSLLLWEYESGKTESSPAGASEYWSECSLVGHITNMDLATIKQSILERRVDG